MRRMLLIVVMGLVVGCGGSKPAAVPDGPTPAQAAAIAEVAKEKQAVVDERAVLAKEREAFKTEQATLDARATARATAIKAEADRYEMLLKQEEARRKEEEAAFAIAEAQRKYKEDVVRMGSLDQLERMRVGQAAQFFRRGMATIQQKYLLTQFHEYRDAVIEDLAKSGESFGGFTKPPDPKAK